MRRVTKSGLFKSGAVCLIAAVLGGCWNGSAEPNLAPLSHAGLAQSVVEGQLVTVDGSASADPDGDPISYRWLLVSKPFGSSAVLSWPTSMAPSFTADLPGAYVVILSVSDGWLSSDAASVTITATRAQRAPVADAGGAQAVAIGAVVTLDGSSSSDANGDALTYSWALVGRPATSAAQLATPGSATTTFEADRTGVYTASLIVNDGRADSAPATMTVTVTVGIPGQGSWQTTLKPRDIDGDGVADAYYDSTLNITWLADANAAAGTPYDSVPSLIGEDPTTGTDGLLYQAHAVSWAAALNIYGVKGWRLPTTVDAAGSLAFPPPTASSEMASMYYDTLGNGAQPTVKPWNSGPFANLRRSGYWTGSRYNLLVGYPGELCWRFNFGNGKQEWALCRDARYKSMGRPYSAWAVRDGDVPHVSPP